MKLIIPKSKSLALAAIAVISAELATMLILKYAGVIDKPYSPILDIALLCAFSIPSICIIFSRKISGKLKTSYSLENMGERSELLLTAVGKGVYGMDTVGNVIFANKAAEAIVGYSAKEMLGRHSHELFHYAKTGGAKYKTHDCNIYATSKDGKVRRVSDEVFWRKDGTPVPVEYTATPVKENGTITGVVVAFEDITERLKMQNALARSEKILNETQAVAKTGSWELDITTNSLYWSAEAYRIFEMDKNEFGASYEAFLDGVHKEDRDKVNTAYSESVKTKKPYSVAHRLQMKDGRVKYVNEQGKTFYDADGKPLRSIGTMQDVTEHTISDEQKDRLAAIIDQSSEMFIVADTAGDIQYVNRAFEAFTGRRRDEIVRKPIKELRSGAHTGSFYDEMWTTITSGKAWRKRITKPRSDGAPRELDALIFPILGEGGKTDGYAALERDVTNEAELEGQIRHMQKMEAIGLLAGGIAHDFNNVLGAILGYTELLLNSVKENPAITADLNEIKKASERATGLTRQLLAFSRKQPAIKRHFNLNDILRGLEKMLARLTGGTVKFALELEPGLKNINADPLQLEQVIMNLTVNARDAMTEGGQITLETKNIRVDEGSPGILGTLPPGEYALLSFRDNGAGMDKTTLSRIFEPFFTTKAPGKGTGLGLSIVYNIVKQNGGCVLVDSEPGRGTAFNIYLPTTATILPGTPRAEDNGAIPRGTGTVLLVDDDAAMRRYIARVLSEAGYTVLDFADAESAMIGAKSDLEALNLLVTDISLPGKNGFELARELSALKPALKTVFISGYTDADKLEENMPAAGALFLQKPFDMLSLLKSLKDGR